MPFCNSCGLEYNLGIDQCPRCRAVLPKGIRVRQRTASTAATRLRQKRLLAGLIDLGIAVGSFLFLFLGRRAVAALVLRRTIGLIVPHAYLLLKDSIDGKSVGKLLMGLITYNEKNRRAAGVLDSIIRNWYLALPVVGPTLFVLVIGAQILSGKGRRLGDAAADTVIITDQEYQGLP
jgi:hypothetical protein